MQKITTRATDPLGRRFTVRMTKIQGTELCRVSRDNGDPDLDVIFATFTENGCHDGIEWHQTRNPLVYAMAYARA